MKYRKSNTWFKHARIIVHPTTIFIVVIAAIVLFLASPNASFESTSVSIFVPEEGTKVFFDNKKERITTEPGETVVIDDIAPGAHLVLTHKDGHWPWSKGITVSDKTENLTINTFGVTQSPSLAEIPQFIKTDLSGENDMYTSINENFLSYVPGKKLSMDRNVEINTDGSNITVKWKGAPEERPDYFCSEGKCDSTFELLPTDREIRNVDFYPGRNDLVLFAAENRILAIELDRRDTQNIQPLFESILNNPDFVRTIDSGIHVKDGDKIYLIQL